MTFNDKRLQDLNATELEEVEAYVLTNILKTRDHLHLLAAAYEEISEEQARRQRVLN